MANNMPDPLAQLRDIHLPAPIGWWPLAWGWYLLFFVAFALLIFGLIYIRHCYRRGQARREGLRLLLIYEKEYQQNKKCPMLNAKLSAKISELLRRVALVYFPREEIAGLQGDLWLEFLNKTGKKVNFTAVRESLLTLPYQSNNTMDLMPLFTCARTWIKQRRMPCFK